MSYLRFKIDLAIKRPIPPALQEKIPEIRAAIRRLKALAENINRGKVNQEFTTQAVYYICHHDDGTACEDEQEI